MALQIISEEHTMNEVDASSVSPAATLHPEVTTAIPDDHMVPAEDIRVWIDPLDATQEYTGQSILQQTLTIMSQLQGRVRHYIQQFII